MIELIREFWHVMTHLNEYLNVWAGSMGGWLYVLLFVVVFCETGLVVTPFLPGDSLLFAIGALCVCLDTSGACSQGTPLAIGIVMPLLMVAAILGDAVNYSVGRHVGPRVFTSEKSLLLNKKHLLRTQEFYERYGGKTIIIARFVPIVRTFAPFVAGIGQMRYARFAAFNVIGAVLWVGLFVPAGYWFGNQPVVKKNFSLVILAIIAISVMPAVIEILREWRSRRVQAGSAADVQG